MLNTSFFSNENTCYAASFLLVVNVGYADNCFDNKSYHCKAVLWVAEGLHCETYASD